MPGAPTTLVLVRHGVTDHTTGRRFSGGLAGADPGLSEEGRQQVRSVGEWLAPLADRIDVIVSSPVRRTRESAEILGELVGREVAEEPGFAEMEFGAWDGLTFDEVTERHRDDLESWLGSVDIVPGGTGESLRTVEERVLAARDRCLAEHAGRTVVVVSHVTPIKTMLAHTLEAPLQSMYRMELAPASVSVLAFWPAEGEHGPWATVRLLNALPPDRSWLGEPPLW
jgi:probable phosphoglycerate mutase